MLFIYLYSILLSTVSSLPTKASELLCCVSGPFLPVSYFRIPLAVHTPLQPGDSVRYKAPPHLSESELSPWIVFVSLHARNSHPQHFVLTQFSPLSPPPPFILSCSCPIFPISSFVFFYDSSTSRALIPIFQLVLASVLPSVSTILSTIGSPFILLVIWILIM